MSQKHAMRTGFSIAIAIFCLPLIGGFFTPVYAGHIGCGAVLGPGGVHVLDSDVGPCPSNSRNAAIKVLRSATLDMNGFTVSCADTNGDDDGILFVGKDALVTDTSVVFDVNGEPILKAKVTGCFAGVQIKGTRNTVAVIISESNKADGFFLTGKNNKVQFSRAQFNERHGFASNGIQNTLEGNLATFNRNAGYVIQARAKGNLLSGNEANSNIKNGFEVLGNNINGLESNEAIGNLANGFVITGNNKILIDNKSTGHTAGHGFLVQGNSNKLRPDLDPNNPGTRNFAENNSGAGFKIIGNLNILEENEASTNTEEGFKIEGNRNKLQENIAFFNGANGFEDGFDIEGDNNILIDNSAEANTRDGFEISGTNNQVFRENLPGGNLAEGNGQNGFSISGNFNTLNGNTANDNVGLSFSIGIRIEDGFVGNDIINNTATGNFAVDLVDENGDCASNTWSGNTFITKDPPCIN